MPTVLSMISDFIGVILERLNSKIIDVERLDRNIERSDDTHNWTIKATIRGEVMRELGVLYNSNYYAISEHPGYGGRRGSGLDDEDDLPDEDDIDGDDGAEGLDSIGMFSNFKILNLPNNISVCLELTNP